MDREPTNPGLYPQEMQPVTRGECIASTNRMLGAVGDLRDDVVRLGDRFDKSTERLEIITSDMVGVAKKQAEDRAFRRGQEEGARKMAVGAVSIRGWILGALTVGGAIASAVWFIAERVG